MAAKVIWSLRAQRKRFEILKYWENRNKSKTYSRKLYELFKVGMAKVAKMPESGIPTDDPAIRTKVIRDYLIYYHINSPNLIEVLSIWDSRRNPKTFEL